MEKILQAENFVFHYQRKSRDCGDHVVWLVSMLLAIQHDFQYAHLPPAEKSFLLRLEIFNFPVLFFFLPNFD